MKVLIVLCLVAGAFASCPANSHYEGCGTACPLTCKNYQDPPIACVLMCNPGCHCDEGYVKDDAGNCIKPEQCPEPAEEACPPNSHYNGCGTACPVTCDNYQDPPIACIRMCNPGCHCDEGYVKTEDGNCVKPEQCPSAAEEASACLGAAETGMCRGYFPMWHYDVQSGTCKKFVYGGCGGNGNRYATEEQCLERFSALRPRQSSSNALCELPAETGLCRGYFPRFHFDSASGECKEFVYGGCGGNGNNFKTLDECHNTCGNSQATCGANERYTTCGTSCPLTCDNFQNPPKICNLMCNIGCECVEGYVRSADGRCVKPENCPARALDRPDCDKGAEPGLCDAYFPRFYYDQEAGMCKKFIYGGCGGNRNNFETEFECYNKCGALASPDIKAACHMEKVTGPCRAMFPRFYYNKQSGQCEIFLYGGCQGNDNNFASKKQCEEVCLS